MATPLYKLIEFTNETRGKERSVGFVPCGWIVYDPVIGTLVSKFMPPPYDQKNLALLRSLVVATAPAPEDWPVFPISILGEARSYKDAVKKVDVLKHRNYAYSTDSEQSAQKKAAAATRQYKIERFQKDKEQEKELWKVPTLEEYDSADQSPDASSSNSSCNGSDKIEHKGRLKRNSGQAKTQKKTNKSKNVLSFENAKVPKVISEKPERSKSTKRSIDEVMKDRYFVAPQPKNDFKNARAIVIPASSSDMRIDPKSSTSSGSQKQIDNINTGPTIIFDEMLPVVDADDPFAEDFSNELSTKKMICAAFRSHSIQLTKIFTELQELKGLLTKNKNDNDTEILNTENFAYKYGLHLPFKELQDFQNFDKKLKVQQTLREETKLNMYTCVDSKCPVTHSIRNIIKKYMSRDVVQQYTAVKETATKLVFQQTTFCSCIQDVITAEYKRNVKRSPITNKVFYRSVGSVINSSKDWEGHRTIRAKKDPATKTTDGDAHDQQFSD